MIIFRSDSDQTVLPRRRWKKRWLIGFAFGILLVALGARILVVRSFDGGPMPPTLAVAGGLPVTLANGKAAHLRDLLRPGVPTIISLWASWCGPCRKEAPKILEIRHRFGANKLNMVYLNAREPGVSRADLADYLTSVGMDPGGYAVLDDRNLAALTKDAENLIPRTYVFDAGGKPIAKIVGYNPLALARVAGLIEG